MTSDTHCFPTKPFSPPIQMKHTRAVAGLLIAALALSMAAPAMAAPGSIDTTQTDTTDTVYIADQKVIDSSFNASGAYEWNLTVQSVPDAADLAMNVSHDGVTYYSYSGDFSDYADGDPDTTASTTGEYHAFSGAKLSSVPMGISENVTLNVTYWNASADNATPTTVQVFVENTDERTVAYIGSSALDTDMASVTNTSKWLGLSTENFADVSAENRDVNGSNTDVVVALGEDSVVDQFASATEDTNPLPVLGAEAESGDRLLGAPATVSGTAVPVYFESAPDDANKSATYAIYSSSGTPTLTYNLGKDYDDRSSVDVSATGGAGFGAVADAYGYMALV